MEPSADDLDEKNACQNASCKTLPLQANNNKMDVKILYLYTISRAKIVFEVLHA